MANKKGSFRSEEVKDIVDKIPSGFGIVITILVFALTATLLILGWFIKYPDIVTGEITITSASAPIRITTNATGLMRLNIEPTRQSICKGDYLAVMNNTARLEDVLYLRELLGTIKPDEVYEKRKSFREDLIMGELESKYFALLDALYKLNDYLDKDLMGRQKESLVNMREHQSRMLAENQQIEAVRGNGLAIYKKFLSIDSMLYTDKIKAENELDKSSLAYLNNLEAYKTVQKEILMNRQQLEEVRNKLEQLDIQRIEKERQLKFAVVSAYNDLLSNLDAWEQKYVLKSPIDGKIEFVKAWKQEQFMNMGEEVFVVVPLVREMTGYIVLPAGGAGKVKLNQPVSIKINHYPYLEFGVISAHVTNISLTSSKVKMDNLDQQDAYMVKVDLDNGLKTNYGVQLEFRHEIRGLADITTNDRRLIHRLFDNIKYLAKRK